jgi:hypothetical protein
MEKIFHWLGVIGDVIIIAICLVVVDEPFEIVARGMVMDYNNITLVAVPITIVYMLALCGIYKLINFIKKSKSKVES